MKDKTHTSDKNTEKNYVDNMKGLVERKKAENKLLEKILTQLNKPNEEKEDNTANKKKQ